MRAKLPFGKHERATLYQGVPDYASVVSSELSGENIDKLCPVRDDRGQMLVMGKPPSCPLRFRKAELNIMSTVSTSGVLRDELRHIVRGHLHQRVKMIELEYQP